MSSETRNAAENESSANVLIEKLSALVRDYFDGMAQPDDMEVEALRVEVLQLRAEVGMLKKEIASSKLVDSRAPESNNGSFLLGQATSESLAYDEDACADGAAEHLEVGNVAAEVDDDLPRFRSHRSSCFADEQEMAHLERRFCALDPEKKDYIDINKLSDWLTKHLNHKVDDKDAEMRKYRIAVHKLNKGLGIQPHSITSFRREGKGHIQLPTFRVLMLEEEKSLMEQFGSNVTKSLMGMRQVLVQDMIVQQIAETWRVSAEEVAGFQEPREKCTVMKVLEPLAGMMIFLNALAIGLSLDYGPNWRGWLWFETFFTLFFLLEFLIRVRLHGCYTHFFGDDWAWNWFDFLIVCSAVFDNVATLAAETGLSGGSSINLNHLLILRLLRLVRISRLIRLLRFKIFKELLLMINGAIAGSRTLFWAMVMLAIIVYSLGVFMRQVMDFEDNECIGRFPARSDCNRGVMNMGKHGYLLFGTVARSMLTVFTCFTDGCESPDGTPLVWHLWDTRGPLLVLAYVSAFILVVFGVLNLICSVFVENTLANSQKFDAQRDFGDKRNKIKKAQELRDLLVAVCTSSDSAFSVKPRLPAKARTSLKSSTTSNLVEMFSRRLHKPSETDLQSATPESQPSNMLLHITQDQFEEIMLDPKVHILLDDLDISWSSREQLFHILDADGNGVLAISELVDGIMKLRGPADKGDFVSSILMVRQLQKQLSKFENHVNEYFQVMGKSMGGSSKRMESMNRSTELVTI